MPSRCGAAAPAAALLLLASARAEEECASPEGNAYERCAKVQVSTGLQCCDDPNNLLESLTKGDVYTNPKYMRGEATDPVTCEFVASYFKCSYCGKPVNTCNDDLSSLVHMGLPDSVTATGLVRDLCPKYCVNQVGAPHSTPTGCECARSYDKGCPTLDCYAPNTQKYDWNPSCDDCEVHGAGLKCTQPGDNLPMVLTVLFILGVIAVVALEVLYVVRVVMKTGPKEQPNTDTTPRKRRGTAVSVAITGIATCMEKYRLLWGKMFYNFGWQLSHHRKPFWFGVVTLSLLFCICGLPQLESDTDAGSAEWAPEGGRLETQIDFTKLWIPTSAQVANMVLLVGPDNYDPSGPGAMTKFYLNRLHAIYTAFKEIRIPVLDDDGCELHIQYQDLCSRIPETSALNLMFKLPDGSMPDKPCLNPSPLDCFYEGQWQFEDVQLESDMPDGVGQPLNMSSPTVQSLAQAAATLSVNYPGQVETYSANEAVPIGRRTYKNMTDAELLAHWNKYMDKSGMGSNSCKHWAVGFSFSKLAAFGGAVPRDPINCVNQAPADEDPDRTFVSAKFLVGGVSVSSVDQTQESRARLRNIPKDSFRKARTAWFDAVNDFMENANKDEVNYPNVRVSCFFADSIEKMVSEMASARATILFIGNIIMVIYIIISQVDLSTRTNNLWAVAIVYFITSVVLSFFAAVGFMAICGVKINHMTVQVLPFISLGLGCDDMFLLLHYYRSVPKTQGGTPRPTDEIIGDLLNGGGRSVSLTSLTNFIAFFGGVQVSIPALRNFMLSAGVVVTFNYFCSIFSLPVILAYWTDYCSGGGQLCPISCIDKSKAAAEADAEAGSPRAAAKSKFSIQRFIERGYSPCMQGKVAQIILTVIWMFIILFSLICGSSKALLGAEISSIAPLKFGFDFTDYAPEGSYLAQGVGDWQDNVYSQQYGHSWILQGGGRSGLGVDYSDPATQRHIQRTSFEIGKEPGISEGANMTHWMMVYYIYLQGWEADPKRNPRGLKILHYEDYVTKEPALFRCREECHCSSMPDCDAEPDQQQRDECEHMENQTIRDVRFQGKRATSKGVSKRTDVWKPSSNGEFRTRRTKNGFLEEYGNQLGLQRWNEAPGRNGPCYGYRPGYPWWADQAIMDEGKLRDIFWELFHTWRNPATGGIESIGAIAAGATSWGYKYGQSDFKPAPASGMMGDGGCVGVESFRGQPYPCNDTNEIIVSWRGWARDARCLTDSDAWISHIDRMRSVISTHLGGDVYPMPSNAFFNYEQFTEVLDFYRSTAAIALAGCFIATMVVPVSAAGAVIITLTAFASCLELLAVCMLAGIDFSTILAVILVAGLGMVVDPAIHMVSAYEHADQSGRGLRLDHAIRRSVIPILEGGFSSFLGFVMLATLDFPYIWKYCFLPLLFVICVGVLQGAVFLPAVLGLVGSQRGHARATRRETEKMASGEFTSPGVTALAVLPAPADGAGAGPSPIALAPLAANGATPGGPPDGGKDAAQNGASNGAPNGEAWAAEKKSGDGALVHPTPPAAEAQS